MEAHKRTWRANEQRYLCCKFDLQRHFPRWTLKTGLIINIYRISMKFLLELWSEPCWSLVNYYVWFSKLLLNDSWYMKNYTCRRISMRMWKSTARAMWTMFRLFGQRSLRIYSRLESTRHCSNIGSTAVSAVRLVQLAWPALPGRGQAAGALSARRRIRFRHQPQAEGKLFIY